MSKLNYPDRIVSLSDCHGGQESWNPITSPDIAARLAEGIRSDLPGTERIDTYGAPERLFHHVVREAVRLHEENPESDPTGLFINDAPRTKKDSNGSPFYRADFGEGLRVVATPLSVLAAVRDKVKRLQVLPNEGNGLYGTNEQHRSSFTPRLLADNHGLQLQDVDPGLIPELPIGNSLVYVDRFGNIVLHEQAHPELQSIRSRIAENVGEKLQLQIGGQVRTVQIGKSLGKAEPGSLVVYANDDSIEVLGKWDPSWGVQERIQNSAWVTFGRPKIGSDCQVKDRREVVSLAAPGLGRAPAAPPKSVLSTFA